MIPEWHAIALDMLGRPENGLAPKLKSMLQLAAARCALAGGELRSRQAIAAIIATWEATQSKENTGA